MVLCYLAPGTANAGPTDDPEPVELGHYEFYTFSTETIVSEDTSGALPAVSNRALFHSKEEDPATEKPTFKHTPPRAPDPLDDSELASTEDSSTSLRVKRFLRAFGWREVPYATLLDCRRTGLRGNSVSMPFFYI
jgi:hypothetical protein